ncbi:beta-lactamase family protein, partial [candidate division KSB1 bacterium]|nr:beta-lactamase family protein [candidate division KSB1 bacterium]
MKAFYAIKRFLSYFLILLFTFAYSSALYPQGIEQKVDEYLNLLIKQNRFSGTILIAKDGEVLLKKGYNFANIELDVPNTPQTVFRLGSITKQFTSMLIMQLVEEKKIELEKTIADYLPYYRRDTGSRITVHHLLTHTPGIPSYTTPEWFENDSRDPYN